MLATGLDPLFVDEPEHTLAIVASVKQRIAFGDRRGQKVRTIKRLIHRAFGYGEDEVITTGNRCVAVNSFSLHAATRIKKGRRQPLEPLIRYTARGPFSRKRLSQESDGDLRYTHFKGGFKHLKNALTDIQLDKIQNIRPAAPAEG